MFWRRLSTGESNQKSACSTYQHPSEELSIFVERLWRTVKYEDIYLKDYTDVPMLISGLVTLDPDGKTAKGRWYGFGGIFMPGATPATSDQQQPATRRSFVSGIYEMGYIKENGIWKILSINWIIPYALRIGETKIGDVPVLTGTWSMPEDINRPYYTGQWKGSKPDVPVDKADLRYVTGYIFPFHFKHPVTGKETSERTLNARLQPVKT
jgi:hypothetical protein